MLTRCPIVKQITPLVLLFLATGVNAAEVYRWIDADGRIVYSDRPNPDAPTETITIRSSGPETTPAPTAAQPVREASANTTLGAEVPREPTPAELAENRARNCESALERNETYSTAHRLYRELADGEREWLSSEEIDQARVTAAADVAAWCD
jgi:hypothetical protein